MDEVNDFTDTARESWLQLRPNESMLTFDVAMRIRRLEQAIRTRLEELVVSHGLSVFGDYEVLAAIRRSNIPLQPNFLASTLTLTRAGVTGRLNRLEAQGLVVRNRVESDARGVLVSLTSDGVRCTDQVFAALLVERGAIFSPLQSHELRQLAELLKRLLIDAETDDLGDHEGPPV